MRATRWPIIFVIAAAHGFGAGRVDEFLGVKSWHGTIQFKASGSGTSKGGAFSDVWQFGDTSNFDINLDTFVPNSQSWTGTFKGTANVNATDVSTLSGCVETLGLSYMGPLGVGKTFTLHLTGDNQYMFFPSDYVVQGVVGTTEFSCAGKTSMTGTGAWLPGLGTTILTLPATGFVLKGSIDLTMNSPVQPPSVAFGGTPAQVKGTLTWDIEPGAIAPNEVVVQKTPALMSWRPTAGPKGGKGNTVDLIAKLQQKGGAPSPVKAAYFTWELTKCSKEPGYAMNSEVDSSSQVFDMKIETGADLIIADATAQKAQTKPGELLQSTITIGSYDWGGFGTIKVTAYLPDNSTLVGYLEGDEQQTDIRLPLRSASSNIADAWKKQHPEIDGLADITDNESDPVGDGTPGDGLTLYEEYRGFIIGGDHKEGDPKKKDYFVVNFGGASFTPAFKLFESTSELKVHSDLTKHEVPASRVINQNHGEGAHLVDQHAVVVIPIAADTPYAVARGGPGTPKSITQIECPMILASSGPWWGKYVIASLTHELFHSVNVYHHGDRLMSYVTWTKTDTDTIVEQGVVPDGDVSEVRVVHIIDEGGQPNEAWLPLFKSVQVCLGLPDDPHVGPDFCVMRYDNANGYPAKTPFVRYYIGREDPGSTICNQTAGTGVNDPERSPQARYGDCAAGRGHCKAQVVVNDAANAPKR